jgi:uncharacterized damage-inducible protein DinB
MLAAMEPSLYDRDLDAYLEQFKEVLGDRNPFVVQAETPDRLEAATRGLSNEHLRTPERPGKWSVIQVAQHLADTEIALAFRSRKVLAEDQPDIPGYDQERWATRLNYNAARLEDALAQFRVLRNVNLRLYRSVNPADLERYGNHSERGRESVINSIRLYAAHDLYHLGQIERIKKAIGAPVR